MIRSDAHNFWYEDLSAIEGRLLDNAPVTDLPVMSEDWRVPNQGTVLAFKTVNMSALISKFELRVCLRALKQVVFKR